MCGLQAGRGWVGVKSVPTCQESLGAPQLPRPQVWLLVAGFSL